MQILKRISKLQNSARRVSQKITTHTSILKNGMPTDLQSNHPKRSQPDGNNVEGVEPHPL